MSVIHTTETTAMDHFLSQKIESILLSDPNITDCAVLFRQTTQAVAELIIFYVPQGPLSQSQLRTDLHKLELQEELDIHFVPLFKIPLTADGLPDYQALAAIPILDDNFLYQSEQMLQMQAVLQKIAMVRIQHEPTEDARYHLADLLPGDHREHPLDEPQQATTPELVKSTETRQSSIINGGELDASEIVQHATLLDVLRNVVKDNPNQTIRFVSSDGAVTEWRYEDLWNYAERILAGLVAKSVQAGDKLVFQMHGNPDILSTFWACQMGGFIPVIVEVPTSYEIGNQALERVIGLMQLLNNPLIVADHAAATEWAIMTRMSHDWEFRICHVEELKNSDPCPSDYTPEPDDIAFFNLSSGSTGTPKCIMLTHRNLVTRAYGTNQLCGYSSSDVILNWLPFDHIGSISDWHIRCVLLGCELIYVDRDYVLEQPVNWLHLIDRFRVTHSWSPNFAFALIYKQLDSIDTPNWDLSCVKGLLTAGEAVSDSSVHGFIQTLGNYGLKPFSVQPAFGMAELGSGITYFVPTETNPARFHIVHKPSMGSAIEWVAEDSPTATHFADLGPPIPGVSLRIVDNDNQVLPLETVGRLQVKGDAVFRGYFENPIENAASFQADGWFNTGDLGFLTQGNLVLTGREKDTIIIKGSNYYSHEIEEMAMHVIGVEPSFTAACGVRRIQDAEEKLAIFFVPKTGHKEAALVRSLRSQIANHLGISPSYLVPLEKQEIPKTAIGKIQRTQLKQRLEAGEFDAIVKRVDLILGNSNTLPAWFYRSCWIPKQVPRCERPAVAAGLLVLMGDIELGEALANQYQNLNKPTILVRSGDQFKSTDNSSYQINLFSKADYVELFRHLQKAQIAISQVVSLIDYQSDEAESVGDQAAETETPLNVSVFLNLFHAVSQTDVDKQLKRLCWVANSSQSVARDELGSANKSMMTGLIKTLSLEHPALECSHIDLPLSNAVDNAQRLALELNNFSKEASIAYRQDRRYVPRLKKLEITQAGRPIHKFERGGHYLITGGLGALGFELCRKLGRAYSAKLLIIGRSALVQDSKNQHLQHFQTLVNEKIECTYAQADVSDRGEIEKVVVQAERMWGHALDGIFHLAGAAHEHSLEEETIEGFVSLARSKCHGTAVLGDLLKSRKDTFLVAFSSVNAFFGGSNTGSYAAANAYMDAHCRYLFRSGYPAYCYAWSLWDGLGMSANTVTNTVAAAKGFYPLSLDEGLNSLSAVLHSGQPEALIGLDASKRSIRSLLADSAYEMESVVGVVERKDTASFGEFTQIIPLQDRFGLEVNCPVKSINEFPLTEDGLVDKNQLVSLIAQGGKTKKKPENPVETKLVELWHDLLKVSDIGTADNFFELGGDSLLVVQLVALIDKAFQQHIPASTVFHAPTIEQLAEVLNRNQLTPEYFSLVPIKSGGYKTPLYIVQSDSWEFVRYLDPDQPVYGLNYGVGAKTTEDKLKLPESLEELAAHFIEEIIQVQPKGPYFIVGHSNAGLLAYEMAQQLVTQHKTIGLVGLIDTWYLNEKQSVPARSKLDKLFHLISLPLKEQLANVQRRVKYSIRQIQLQFFTAEHDIPFLDRAMHLYECYEPKPYPGKIDYFKCSEHSRLEPIENHEKKWEELAQDGISVHSIPCSHDVVLKEPHVRYLAESMAQYL